MGQLAKIRFNLQNVPVGGETVWAEEIGDHRYRLVNIPFDANGYAEGDVVRCTSINGTEEVVGMEQDSGNGTIRIKFSGPESTNTNQILDELTSVGCTYER